MRICEFCMAQGCTVCNDNGVVGGVDNGGSATGITDADRAYFRWLMQKMRAEYFELLEGK